MTHPELSRDTFIGPFPLPEPDDAMRADARTQPGEWIVLVDPAVKPGVTDPPGYAVQGAYQVDGNGQLSGEYQINPDYAPSPHRIGYRFDSGFELTLWRVLHGYNPMGMLADSFYHSKLLAYADPNAPDQLPLFTDPDQPALSLFAVCTSPTFCAWDTTQPVLGKTVFELAADSDVVIDINPGTSLSLRIPARDLFSLTNDETPHLLEKFGKGEGKGQASEVTPESEGAPVTELDAHERFVGSMLAGAMGDALGYGIEFKPMRMIRQSHGDEGLTAPLLRDGIAQISDDTQMMLFTLEGLIRAHVARRIEPRDNDPVPEVQHAYQRWLHTQNREWLSAGGPYAQRIAQPDGWLITNPGLLTARAPGNTCMTALLEYAQSHRIATFQHRVNDSKGCGGVMRAAPVALWSHDPAEVFHVAAATAALTHSHPSGFLSAGVLATIVHQLIRDVPLRDCVATAREILVRWPGHEEQLAVLDKAVHLAQGERLSPESLEQQLGGGWVGEEALAIGLYAVMATDNLRDALLLSVNHSGDSDSTGIVAGNIAGAIYGARDIPPEWLSTLELHDVISRLTEDALAEFSPGPPNTPEWTQRYPAW